MKYEPGTVGHLRHLLRDISDFVPVVFYFQHLCGNCTDVEYWSGHVCDDQEEVEDGLNCVAIELMEV